MGHTDSRKKVEVFTYSFIWLLSAVNSCYLVIGLFGYSIIWLLNLKIADRTTFCNLLHPVRFK